VNVPFLTAEWRWLLLMNYECDPRAVQPYLPAGTELDAWNNTHYVSMVGFLFLDTRVRGLAIPLHRNFEEVNLRFYVRHKANGAWRRGVVFIKELVPRWAIATVARSVYGENYQCLPMRHNVAPPTSNAHGIVQYEWRHQRQWNAMRATIAGVPRLLVAGSEEEFISEHYWGYTRQRSGRTMEYRVDHPSWRVWHAEGATLQCDAASLYGPAFAEVLSTAPKSAFVAEGSEVSVMMGRPLDLVTSAA